MAEAELIGGSRSGGSLFLPELMDEYLRPLVERIEALEAALEEAGAKTEGSGVAEAFPKGVSTTSPKYNGQVKFLTDLGYPAYGYQGAWRKFSDDSAV